MRARRRVAAPLLAAAMVAIAAARGGAQEGAADSMDFMRQRVQQDKKLFIAQNLDLTEAEAKAFWPVYERFQSEMVKIQERKLRVVGDYITAYPNLPDELARRLLDDALAVEADWVRLYQAFAPQFRQALPDRKVVRYYQLENKIHALVTYELAAKIPVVK